MNDVYILFRKSRYLRETLGNVDVAECASEDYMQFSRETRTSVAVTPSAESVWIPMVRTMRAWLWYRLAVIWETVE